MKISVLGRFVVTVRRLICFTVCCIVRCRLYSDRLEDDMIVVTVEIEIHDAKSIRFSKVRSSGVLDVKGRPC